MTATAPSTARPVDAAGRSRDVSRDVLLRCWLRETGQRVAAPGPQVVPLPATGASLVIAIEQPSRIGTHRIAGCTDAAGDELDVEAIAALLTREAAARTRLGDGHRADALARIVDSAHRAASYATRRATEPAAPVGLPRWLAGEQGLLAGHPWHPMTKSRDGLPETDDVRFSPETRGRFPLHWFAAGPAVAAISGPAGAAMVSRLAGDLPVPDGFVPVPAHPWQAARLADRPAAARLLAAGDLVDLGPSGPDWWATSSLRTVARPGSPVMLKLSLGLRVTNSRRENLREELLLGARTAALVDAGLGAALAAAHPGFRLVRDPAWVGVDAPDGPVGLDTVVREQPFHDTDEVWCAGALLDARPDLGEPPAADLVRQLAAHARRPVARVAEDWLTCWLDAVAEPLLWLHGTWGIGLEAHLQNVLVGLDPHGWPERGFYRDNQGWYAARSRAAELERLLPGCGDGVPLVFDDRLVTERVTYYLAVNHLLGLVGALAHAGLAPEERLLVVLRDFLRRHAARPDPSPVATALLEAHALPAKANLLTGVDGRDELAGTVEAQSVYVAIPNPLVEVTR